MTRDFDPPTRGPADPDDDPIARLVRVVADDWRMPPQRLDQPTWRDRVGEARGRGSRSWLVRLAGPAFAAIVATVVVAFVAVWLTAPRSTPGKAISSPGAPATAPVSSGSAAPSPVTSPRPTGSGFPAVVLNGALPAPGRVMVNAGDTYRVADLATGSIGIPAIARYSGPTILVPAPDGWACICGNWTHTTGGLPSALALSLATIKADGTPGTTTPIRTIQGALDPSASLAGCLRLDRGDRRCRCRDRRGARFSAAPRDGAGRRQRTSNDPARAAGRPVADRRWGPRVELLVCRR
jgi:hypothetical protein